MAFESVDWIFNNITSVASQSFFYSDRAEKIRYLVDGIEPDAEKIILVMDNLNTHSISSLYKAFPPEEVRRIARKLEVHHTHNTEAGLT